MVKKLQQIKKSDIEDEYSVCVYCYDRGDGEDGISCCGEMHFEYCYFIKDGDAYLESECELVE